jgi:hypothetical protein
MCGLCGFGLADAELVLGRNVPKEPATEQPQVDASQSVADPISRSLTSGEEVAEPALPDGLIAVLWSRFRLALSGHLSPSHSH